MEPAKYQKNRKNRGIPVCEFFVNWRLLFRVILLICLKKIWFLFRVNIKFRDFRKIFKEIRGFPVLHCNAVGMKQCQGFSFPRVLPGSFYNLSYFAVELLWEHLVTHLFEGRCSVKSGQFSKCDIVIIKVQFQTRKWEIFCH